MKSVQPVVERASRIAEGMNEREIAQRSRRRRGTIMDVEPELSTALWNYSPVQHFFLLQPTASAHGSDAHRM